VSDVVGGVRLDAAVFGNGPNQFGVSKLSFRAVARKSSRAD
jgi:hypothetical protein